MFGTLRLALALMVVSTHAGVTLGTVLPGVVAVIVFFLISGFAMTGLLETRFSAPGSIRAFFLERFVRLAPQYYFWIAVAMVQNLVFKMFPLNLNGFMPWGLIAYLTVVPLGLQGYLGLVETYIMAQASTLGVEITFYLAAPWLLKHRWLALASGLLCLGIFIATQAGLLTPAMYTYYTSPGPLILFLMGSFLYRRDYLCLGILGSASIAVLSFRIGQPYNTEYLVGIIVGLPVMALLRYFSTKSWDSALGNASYGCYLCHGILIFGLNYVLGGDQMSYSNPLRITIVIVAGVIGYLGYHYIERPTVDFRRRLRGRGAAMGADERRMAAE